MNKLAEDLNQTILTNAPDVFNMLSPLGKELYFPKGILSQTAEAKQKATRFNATIGIAKEGAEAMHLPSVMKQFSDHVPNDLLPYAPTTGKPELRNKWMEQMLIKNPTLNSKSVGLPIVTSGITHGLSLAADLFVERGDILLLPQQFWGNYNMIFGVKHGATVKHYRFFSQNNGFDTDDLRRTALEYASSGKLIVILNFPNNPTGYSVTESEAKAIRDVLVEVAEGGCNVVAICDDSYFGLFYEDDVCKESVFAYLANQHPRLLAIKLDGATKEDYVWGFRVGFITFATAPANSKVYDALEKKTGGAIRGNISNCPHLSQTIVLKAMADEKYLEEKQQKFAIMKARASKVKETLSQEHFAKVWTPYPFNSGYFMCLRMSGIDAEEFRLRLLEKYGIGVIASGKEDIRVAFSCVEENDLPVLFEQMYQCAREM
ncbi:MAG: aminotransferase class I/II-fold pyridoxal phosphate-dependent enzyme [Candidatus Brocadiia bacterium]|nr:MAG: aminotransferase class I/II-fold pyridoxal phosphate-dependent enzyme [Candidatus Brocadiia bacterium]